MPVARWLYGIWLGLLVFGALFDLAQVTQLSSSGGKPVNTNSAIAKDIQKDLGSLEQSAQAIESEQTKDKLHLVDMNDLNQAFELIKLDVRLGEYAVARDRMNQLHTQIDGWQTSLITTEKSRRVEADKATAKSASDIPTAAIVLPGGMQLPILMYHKTPPDFDSQIARLISKGYRGINMDEAAASIRTRSPLPGKPLVITFDDGFSDQMTAYNILKKYNFKATFYIISGGEASRFCIGANRTNNSCGDSYLRWGQIRELDSSGLIEIAGHTVDHLGLAGQPPSVQEFQIKQNKADIEQQIGHSIRHFAYPYGSFNATTISLVRAAGYSTAVSTITGTSQSPDILYSLHRVRDVSKLP